MHHASSRLWKPVPSALWSVAIAIRRSYVTRTENFHFYSTANNREKGKRERTKEKFKCEEKSKEKKKKKARDKILRMTAVRAWYSKQPIRAYILKTMKNKNRLKTASSCFFKTSGKWHLHVFNWHGHASKLNWYSGNREERVVGIAHIENKRNRKK